jgi:uncharacterized protein YigE (DUF2233 family)
MTVREETFKGNKYSIAALDLKQEELRLFWKDDKGKPFTTFRSLETWLKSQKKELLLATNAGIFDTNEAPLGVHMEQGNVIRPLNTQSGAGNFYLKPNGVFSLGPRGAEIVTTERFRPNYREATQSGPLLVIKNRINPKFSPTSHSTYIRNGIGVQSPHKVFIVKSQNPVTFHDFASLFKDSLKCPDALYLDGSISRLYCPSHKLLEDGHFVGMIGVLKK